MRKIFYLLTCSTCKRILSGIKDLDSFELQDVKTTKLSLEQLEELKNMAGSYEALFSRRSRQYSAMNLKEKSLREDDYKSLILKEYSFLKRPVSVVNKDIFIGSSKSEVEALYSKVNQ